VKSRSIVTVSVSDDGVSRPLPAKLTVSVYVPAGSVRRSVGAATPLLLVVAWRTCVFVPLVKVKVRGSSRRGLSGLPA
jgi:hypothetical protein